MIEDVERENVGEIKKNVSMKEHTTYKTGGIVRYMIYPTNINQLKKLLTFIQKNKIKYKVVGNGSNLIFTDDFYDGIIIKLDYLRDLHIEGKEITVGAGYSLMRLSLKLSMAGYTGLEFASGIPGTVGGAIYMNAGAYKSDMGYVIKKVKVLTPDLEIKDIFNKDLDFHYRTSFFKKHDGYVILEGTFHLNYGNKEDSLTMIKERKERRMATQPLEYPSAGSVFRNPEGDAAGRLIEEAGLKGLKVGGAMVSEKHANFIINTGGATSKDLKELIQIIKAKVKEKYDIELMEEQEYVG